ncbi:MAG TPA: hypothetical protein VF098_00705 [Sphingomicrobium sp.]
MFRSKTVFVVGAGASCELSFPSGAQLLNQIADSLDIYFDDGNYMRRGDSRLYQAFQQLAGQGSNLSLNDLQFAGWRVRDAAKLGLSIDNVIHQFADDGLVARVAKLAIAYKILQAEESSSFLRLNTDLRPPNIDLASIRNTWLGGLAQLLVQDLTRSQAERIFDNLAIISFNYDRSIRRFLPFALSSQFGISTGESQEISKQLRIFYPYGSLGPLPWEASEGTEFGDADHAPLIDVSTRIRTFTEQVEESESLASMRQALSEARHVVFLGFGYHRQNMTLLSDGVKGSALRVFGTSQGLSGSDREVVSGQATQFIDTKYQGHINPVLPTLDCVSFIREYFRALTS